MTIPLESGDDLWEVLPESVRKYVYDIVRVVEERCPSPEARIATAVMLKGGYAVGVLHDICAALPSRKQIVLFELEVRPISHPKFRVRLADIRDILTTPYGPYTYSRSVILFTDDFTYILLEIENELKRAFGMEPLPSFVDRLLERLLCAVLYKPKLAKHLYSESVPFWLLKWLVIKE